MLLIWQLLIAGNIIYYLSCNKFMNHKYKYMEGKYYTLKYYTESGCNYYEWLCSVCELTVVSVRRTVLINYQADDLYCIYYVEGE